MEAGHGEGADAMEAGCDNGTGLVMVRGQMLWKPAVIMGQVMWKLAMVRGQMLWKPAVTMGWVMWVRGQIPWKLAVIIYNGTGHVEDSHGEGAGGTVDGRTQKERRIQSSYDTQGLLNVLSKVQKLANKRSGIRTIDTSHNYANTPVITR